MPTDKQRREIERRRLQRQRERRRARDIRRRRFTLIASIVGTVLVLGLVIGFVIATNHESSTPAATRTTPAPTTPATSATAATSSAAPKPAYPCTWTKTGTAAKKATVPPTTTPPRTGTVTVRLTTNRGALTLDLNRRAAPCAVDSFVSLATQKYFDATPCHRLTSSPSLKVLQCGDPTGTGTGGPGYTFGDELTGTEKYSRGVLAMANSGPDTNGSQFFLVYGDSQLPPSYTVFGTIGTGLAVLDAVAAKGSTPATDGKPKLSVTITRATVG